MLDTNVWSDVLRGGKPARKLASTSVARVLLAAPVLYELRRGAVRAARAKALQQAIDDMAAVHEVAHFDADAAEAAAKLGAALASRGRQIQHLDTMIAGIAVARGAVLVTTDNDFKGVAGLKVEDWS
ncbi:MAG: type II toxin-antitoxin system VapC family toxin [Vitreimonas sp.]